MRRGFLNKTKAKTGSDNTGVSSSGDTSASVGGAGVVQGIPAAAVAKGPAKSDFVQPKPINPESPPVKPELEDLTFVTIPPRRPGYPDDPDGHTEVVVPSYGNALQRIRATPGHLKPVPKPPHKNYIIKKTEDMGLGMFATHNIRKGDLIFAERPLFCTPEVIDNAIFDAQRVKSFGIKGADMTSFVWGLSEKRLEHMMSRMSEADREAVMKLENCHEGEAGSGPLVGRVRTNCYGTKTRLWDDVHAKIIPGKSVSFGYKVTGKDASRINHSCTPNAGYYLDLASFSLYFLALKPIKSGDQICYSYIQERAPFEERREGLARYGIVCTCYACTHWSPEADAFRREFPNKINALTKVCNDMMGGLIVLGPDLRALTPGPSPLKPYNALTQGPKLRKEILEPLLRLKADIEKEGLEVASEMTALFHTLFRAWQGIPGEYGAAKSNEAMNEMQIHVNMWAKLYGPGNLN